MGSRQSGHYPYVKDVQRMSTWEFTMFHGHLRRLKVTCLGSLWDGTVLSGFRPIDSGRMGRVREDHRSCGFTSNSRRWFINQRVGLRRLPRLGNFGRRPKLIGRYHSRRAVQKPWQPSRIDKGSNGPSQLGQHCENFTLHTGSAKAWWSWWKILDSFWPRTSTNTSEFLVGVSFGNNARHSKNTMHCTIHVSLLSLFQMKLETKDKDDACFFLVSYFSSNYFLTFYFTNLLSLRSKWSL